MIWVVDSDPVMAECVARAIMWDGSCRHLLPRLSSLGAAGRRGSPSGAVTRPEHDVRIYHDVIDAINGLSEGVPELIFLEVMLAGPDGFTLLNELRSYEDTMRVPVVLVSERDFAGQNLTAYGVVGTLLKDTMRPEQIWRYVEKFTGVREEISA